MKGLSYKHLEITTRPEQSNLVEGRCAFFYNEQLYNVSHIAVSEAECLAQLNKQVKELCERIEQIN